MDEERIPSYLYLIEELLRCSPGREEAVLSDRADLLDADLLKMMKQRAVVEKDPETVKRLNVLAKLLFEKLNPPSRGDREGFMNKDKLNSQFLMEILQAIAENQGNPQVVYAILQRNLAKLDDNLAAWLPTWATARLYEFGFAGSLVSFSNLIAQFPLGNKASNMEIAIAGYETILKVLNRQNDPEIWAKIQNNWANAYSDRVKGDKAENLERAIAAYQKVLSVYTKEAFPADWANTQNNLGTAYWKRIKGDQAENLERAIAAYQQSLSVCTKAVFPMEYADTQNNLGMSYCKRIKGDKAENLEKAIAAYEKALSVYTKKAFPTEWANTQDNLGNVYSNRIKGDKAENLESAIAAYEKALSVYTKKAFPTEWAETQINLGNAYSNRIKGEKLDNWQKGNYHKKKGLEIIAPKALEELQFFTDILRATIDSHGDSQIVYPLLEANLDKLNDRFADNLRLTITDFPEFSQGEPKAAEYMAMAIGDLCNLIQEFPLGHKASNMEIAIAVYQEVLKVLTRDSNPESWAAIQNNLGIAYQDRISGDRAENVENAIRSFDLALSVRTKENLPSDWAATQTNLVNAYRNRVIGNKSDNLENAIRCGKKALQVYAKEEFPSEWAKLQNNLGTAYNERIRGNRADNLEDAIAAYNLAVEVRTKKDCPIDWAGTQNNLATAYFYRIKGDKKENLENTIGCATRALEVYTKENFPYMWAVTQNNLGTFYIDTIQEDKEENIEKAINCLKLALEVHTKENFPIDWAKNKINLGSAYLYRIKEDKEENLEKAISYSTQALSVYTKGEYPSEWATIQRNLGSAYGYRTRGNREDNLAQVIRYSTQALSVHTKEDFPIQWARTQQNLGSAYVRLYNIRGSRVENLKNAILHFNLSLEIHTPQAHPIECLSISRNLGNLHFTQGDWGEAINTYEKAITAVELSRSWAIADDTRQEILAEAIDVYQKQVQAYVNIEQWDKAIETVERSKTRNLVELLANRYLYPKGNVPEEIKTELDRLRPSIPSLERKLQGVIDSLSANTGEPEEQRSLLASQKQLQLELQTSRQQLDEVLDRIKPIDSSFSLTQRVEQIAFGDIQGLMDDRTAAIEWYVTEDKILTFIITANSLRVEQASAEKLEALGNWSNDYFGAYLQKHKEKWIADLAANLQKLAEILNIDRLLARIDDIFDKQGEKCASLILIPHRFLHLFPLHAMPLGNGDLLMERFPQGLSYAPSLQLLQLSQNWSRPSLEKFFSVNNPTGDLNFADLEVATIRSYFSNPRVLTKLEASKTALVSEPLNETNVAHFCCHGLFDFVSPSQSALVLAGATDGGAINIEECLTLGDIFALDLRQCRLATLSACETGLTDFKSKGDEYIGLPSGFLYAGSPSVVSSLWTVNDLSTAFLTIQFYQNLQKGLVVGLALNQAQLWLRDLTKGDLETWIEENSLPLEPAVRVSLRRRLHKLEDDAQLFKSPFYWAAFCAIGQ